jgi:hypothetical protein
MVFNATFNSNSVVLVEETGVLEKTTDLSPVTDKLYDYFIIGGLFVTGGLNTGKCKTLRICVLYCVKGGYILLYTGIGKAMRNWCFQIDCGALRSIICAPCNFWIIILLFHVSIKVVFYFVSWFCLCLHSSLISL